MSDVRSVTFEADLVTEAFLAAGWASESPSARAVLLGLTGRRDLPAGFTIL